MTNSARHAIAALAISIVAGCVHSGDDGPPDNVEPGVARERGAVVAQTLARTAVAPISFGEGFAATASAVVMGSQDGGSETAETTLEADLASVGACTSLAWTGVLAATITFTDCVLANGAVVDGALTLALGLTPPSISAYATALRIDATTLDGGLALRLPAAGTTDPVEVDVDLAVANGGTSLAMDGVTITFAPNTLIIDGTGSVSAPSFDASVDATGIAIEIESCLPSAGTVEFTTPGARGTVEFLPTTPANGIVSIEIPPLAPVPVAVFPPCP